MQKWAQMAKYRYRAAAGGVALRTWRKLHRREHHPARDLSVCWLVFLFRPALASPFAFRCYPLTVSLFFWFLTMHVIAARRASPSFSS